MGNIGDNPEEIEMEPIPRYEPVKEPVRVEPDLPVEEPAEPEKVPA